MVAYCNRPNSTSISAIPPAEINTQHSFFKIIIVGDDVKTARSQRECEEVVLHLREQEILRQQEIAKVKEDLAILEKKKPKEKWYKQFQKHKKCFR